MRIQRITTATNNMGTKGMKIYLSNPLSTITVAVVTLVLMIRAEAKAGGCNAPDGKKFDVVLRPQSTDFTAPYKDRVMISTKQGGGYWTSYQTSDRKLKITATLTPASDAAGRTVYFKVVDPDPDDLSPYEATRLSPDTTPGDNKDTAIGPGVLTPVDGTVVVDGTGVATVELTITDRCSGDNYQVMFSMESDETKRWDHDKVCGITPVYVAWKRIYLGKAGMVYKDFSRHLTANRTAGDTQVFIDNQPLSVGGPRPFKDGDRVLIMDNVDCEYVTVKNPVGDGGFSISGALGKSYIHDYNSSGRGAAAINYDYIWQYELVPDEIIDAFGVDTHGNANAGCFIEVADIKWNRLPDITRDPGLLPYVEMINAADPNHDLGVPFADFARVWRIKTLDVNTIRGGAVARLRKPGGGERTGESDATVNALLVATVYCETKPNPTNVKAETLVHELGHQFGGDLATEGANGSGHVDKDISYKNINGSDECIMSYKNNASNADCDLCAETQDDCIWDIRKTLDSL